MDLQDKKKSVQVFWFQDYNHMEQIAIGVFPLRFSL